MQIVTSGKVQSNFGAIAEIAKFGEPVTITQYGRPTLLLIRYQDGIDALRELAAKNMTAWLEGRTQTAPNVALDIAEDDLNAIIHAEIAK
jgi:antitoxin (DNA-binding transcriptional repressor) of toxin-antitoxin stability system